MLTFKEALCLLAIVIAIFVVYGITGRMDDEDALLLDQARQRSGADCVRPLTADDGSPEIGPTDPRHRARPIEGARSDEPCGPFAPSFGPTRH